MAVGETAGQGRPRKVVSSAARRRSETPEAEAPAPATDAPEEIVEEAAPLVKEADEALERLLEEEENLERSYREHSETPHFRPGDE